jgi:hypothetical protein
MANSNNGQLNLQVADVSGQKLFQVSDIEPDDTVGVLLSRAVMEMNMPQTDVAGRPLVYHARLEREGRHLHPAERIGDAVSTDDRLTILPNIDAGSG